MAKHYFERAAFNAECSSPDESVGCADLYAGEPRWPSGVEKTDNEVLLAYASYQLDVGSGLLSIASLFIGIAGVLLAASAIVRGQAKTRQDVHDALEAREPPG